MDFLSIYWGFFHSMSLLFVFIPSISYVIWLRGFRLCDYKSAVFTFYFLNSIYECKNLEDIFGMTVVPLIFTFLRCPSIWNLIILVWVNILCTISQPSCTPLFSFSEDLNLFGKRLQIKGKSHWKHNLDLHWTFKLAILNFVVFLFGSLDWTSFFLS